MTIFNDFDNLGGLAPRREDSSGGVEFGDLCRRLLGGVDLAQTGQALRGVHYYDMQSRYSEKEVGKRRPELVVMFFPRPTLCKHVNASQSPAKDQVVSLSFMKRPLQKIVLWQEGPIKCACT